MPRPSSILSPAAGRRPPSAHCYALDTVCLRQPPRARRGPPVVGPNPCIRRPPASANTGRSCLSFPLAQRHGNQRPAAHSGYFLRWDGTTSSTSSSALFVPKTYLSFAVTYGSLLVRSSATAIQRRPPHMPDHSDEGNSDHALQARSTEHRMGLHHPKGAFLLPGP